MVVWVELDKWNRQGRTFTGSLDDLLGMLTAEIGPDGVKVHPVRTKTLWMTTQGSARAMIRTQVVKVEAPWGAWTWVVQPAQRLLRGTWWRDLRR